MRKNDGGPAFPNPGTVVTGMSLRDYFAAQALAALIRAKIGDDSVRGSELIADAYTFADGMLDERQKGA